MCGSSVQLESVVTAEVAYMDDGHFRAENRRSTPNVGSHGRARRRKVDREEDILDHFLLLTARGTSFLILKSSPFSARNWICSVVRFG